MHVMIILLVPQMNELNMRTWTWDKFSLGGFAEGAKATPICSSDWVSDYI